MASGTTSSHLGTEFGNLILASALVLAALEPDRIRLAADALEQLELEAKALDTQWQLRLERVRFEAQRAQRQYQAVEPENRLVARHLEQLWEEKLRAVEATEQEYTTWRHEHRAEITAEDRQAILAIGRISRACGAPPRQRWPTASIYSGWW